MFARCQGPSLHRARLHELYLFPTEPNPKMRLTKSALLVSSSFVFIQVSSAQSTPALFVEGDAGVRSDAFSREITPLYSLTDHSPYASEVLAGQGSTFVHGDPSRGQNISSLASFGDLRVAEDCHQPSNVTAPYYSDVCAQANDNFTVHGLGDLGIVIQAHLTGQITATGRQNIQAKDWPGLFSITRFSGFEVTNLQTGMDKALQTFDGDISSSFHSQPESAGFTSDSVTFDLTRSSGFSVHDGDSFELYAFLQDYAEAYKNPEATSLNYGLDMSYTIEVYGGGWITSDSGALYGSGGGHYDHGGATPEPSTVLATLCGLGMFLRRRKSTR